MQSQNPFFDDLARVASGAMGALSGLRAEMEAMIRQQMERVTSSLDMVPREEFEVVRAMAAKARMEQDALEDRVKALEAKLAELTPPADTATASKAKAHPKPKA
jgi:BMFP domain-containing protein YqiC